MNKNTKRVLTISITAVCAVAISFIIGFAFPGEADNETVTSEGYSYDMNADAAVAAPEGEDYESMSKEELLAVIEEKDAEIDELVDKVEALTILAEQTTNSIVVPKPTDSSSDDEGDDETTSTSSPSDEDKPGNSPLTSDTGL